MSKIYVKKTVDGNGVTRWFKDDDATTAIASLQSGKVDKDGSKVLSDENFTTAEKTKLGNLPADAQANAIATISVNGSTVTPDTNKNVEITIPTATNTTYSLTQDQTDGHIITLTPSSGSAQTITIPDTNTWRGIQNNLTSDSTEDSLSAAQGKALKTLVDGKADASHTHVSADITSLDASKLTGTIDIARLPQGALERMTIVSTLADMYDLTSLQIQNGDIVKVTATGQMFYVKDDTKAGTADAFEEFAVGTAASVPWSGVTGKPSTYAPSSHTHGMADITDYVAPTIPVELKNPYGLTVQGNGTDSFTYVGDAAKTLNIKAGSNITVTPANTGDITIAATVPTVPSSLKNPNSLTVSAGNTTSFEYDGENAKTLHFVAGSDIVLSADSTGNITISAAHPITFTTTDPGEGSVLAEGSLVFVYEDDSSSSSSSSSSN